MAISKTVSEPFSFIEIIEEMQKEIYSLSEKIDRLENKIKEQNNGNKKAKD